MAGTQRPMTFRAAEIRDKSFRQRLRGFDVDEVDAFLNRVADHLAGLEQMVDELRRENAELRRENAELRRENAELRASADGPDRVTHQAVVVLLSQAQQVADTLIEEAVQRARKMLSEARAGSRESV